MLYKATVIIWTINEVVIIYFFQNVVGWEYEGKVDKHASQKGTSSQIINVYILQALIINACKIYYWRGICYLQKVTFSIELAFIFYM